MAQERASNQATRYGAIGVAAIAVYFLGKRFINAFKKEGAESELPNDQSAQQAQAFMTAFNPSGSSWLKFTDGTDNKKVFELASQIKDFPKVQKFYKDLYKSSLTEDLGNELSSTELARFWAIINGQKAKTQATAKANETLSANKFKFRIGDKLVSSPLKGNTKVGYAALVNNVFRILGWHTLRGEYIGTISGYFKVQIKDYDGVSRYLSAYYLKDLPNGTKFGSNKIFVLEREVAIQK
jgi:hypothetical protein